MRFVRFDPDRIGVLDEAGIHDVTAAVPEPWRSSRYAMNHLVERFDSLRPQIERLAADSQAIPVHSVRLRPPVPVPLQVLAAPNNNRAHTAEMRSSGLAVSPGSKDAPPTPRSIGWFLKAPGSIVGPGDAIELPDMPGRRFDHEGELAVVIGRAARNVAEADALSHVFGYTGLIDVTLRTDGEHREERPMRKSYHSFTPVGPTLVTADELPDPAAVGIRLWNNEELRQDGSTGDLIVGVAELISLASRVLTLQPGDLYTTGSPAGVGPIRPGDAVTLEIDRVGRMTLPVRTRDW